jgi:hypothetical protein
MVISWEDGVSVKESTLAYIAGFLDGDGSVMLQIKPRKDCRYGFRIYASIVLYQDSSHEEDLRWIGDQLAVGYIARRNDGMSELRIDGYKRVEMVLEMLAPYVRFKRVQVAVMLEALDKLKSMQLPQDFLEVCWLADRLSEANYMSRRKYTSETVKTVLCEKGLLSP